MLNPPNDPPPQQGANPAQVHWAPQPQAAQQPAVPQQPHNQPPQQPFPPPAQNPAVPIPLPPPLVIRTYQDYYTNATADPQQGNYAQIMSDFDAPTQGNARYAPNVLLERVTQASLQNYPMAFISLRRTHNAQGNDPGRLTVCHRISRYPITLQGDPEPWDGNNYAILGNAAHQQVAIVPWTVENSNREPNNLRVLTDQALVQYLAGHPNAQTVGPYEANEDNVMEIRTRYSMIIPHRYVSLVLNTNLTPRQAWDRIYPALTRDNKVDECRPLLNFLKAALTLHAPNNVQAVAREWPVLPRPPNAKLFAYFRQHLQTDLPDAFLPNRTPDATGTHQIATAVGQLADETRLSREADAARHTRKEAGNTIQDIFGDVGVQNLMRLCHVLQGPALPDVYHRLATAPKKQRHGVLQDAITSMAASLNVRQQLFVPPGLVDKVMNLEWTSPDPDDMSLGINPALVGQPTPAEQIQMAHHIALQHQLDQGHASPSLADVQVLNTPATVRLAPDLHDALFTITSFWVYMQTLLGHHHLVTQAILDIKNDLELYQHTLRYSAPTNMGALVVRYVQRVLHFWASAQLATNIAQRWPGEHIISLTAMGSHMWIIPIPAAYLRQSHSTSDPHSTNNPPPIHSSHPPADKAPPERQQMVRRTGDPDPRFDPIRALGIPARTIKQRITQGQIPAPRDANGQQRCLSWTLRGFCNTRCGQAADHREDHTDQEQADFLAWCTEHYHT